MVMGEEASPHKEISLQKKKPEPNRDNCWFAVTMLTCTCCFCNNFWDILNNSPFGTQQQLPNFVLLWFYTAGKAKSDHLINLNKKIT